MSAKLIKKGHGVVDARCPSKDDYRVYEENANAKLKVYMCTLNQTDIRNNNNKFYILQLLESEKDGGYYVFTCWGRVGVFRGQHKLMKCGSLISAKSEFTRTFRTKTGNEFGTTNFIKKKGKYYLCEVDYGDEDDDDIDNSDSDGDDKTIKPPDLPKSKLNPKVQNLVKLLSDIKMFTGTMKELDIDTKKMPLGKMSENQLNDAMKILNDLSKNLNKLSRDDIIDKSSDYYTMIPFSCGMNKPPIIDNMDIINKYVNVINTLLDIDVASTVISRGGGNKQENPIDKVYNSIGTNIIHIDPTKHSKAHNLLKNYISTTHAPTHSAYTLELLDAYAIKNSNWEKDYNDFTRGIGNKRLLWHGSRLCNFVSILTNNLRIAPPHVPANGYMFNKGLYFADSVSKSANYCFTNRQNNIAVLALCEVALGDQLEKLYADCHVTLPPGKHSVWGKGSTSPDYSQAKKDKKGVVIPCAPLVRTDTRGALLYNEFIVYNVNQQLIKYLLVVKFNYRY